MTKTEKYQLPQWELSDRILMEDFNDMTDKIDKGMDGIRKEAAQGLAALTSAVGTKGKTCRIASGTFTRSGGGSVTVDFKPMVVFVTFDNYVDGSVMFRPFTRLIAYDALSMDVTWGDRTVTWSYLSNDLNGTHTYSYIVLGIEED